MAELEEFRAQAALEKQNIELIRNTNETWMKRDCETIRELCAPDFAYYSSNSKPLNIDEVIEHVKTFLKTFPVPCIINFSYPRVSIFPEGEEFFKTYHLS